MKMLKSIRPALTTAAAVSLTALGMVAGASSANAINIGGVDFNLGPHTQVGSIFENVVTGNGQTLSGYGELTLMNGLGPIDFPTGFCQTCELTYEFGGFISQDFTGTTVNFSGGWINYYVDATPDFDGTADSATNRANASDGTLWLTLAGHSNLVGGINAVVFGTGTSLGSGNDEGTGAGLLDVDHTGMANGNTAGAGALANAFFDTDNNPDNIGGFADLTLGSSFGNIGLPPSLEGECANFGFLNPALTCLQGSVDVQGITRDPPRVSEPGTLAVLGLGLIGLMAARRRKHVA